MSEHDRAEKVLDRAYGSRVRIGDRPAQDALNPRIGDKTAQDALIKLLKDLAAGRAPAAPTARSAPAGPPAGRPPRWSPREWFGV